MNAHMTLQIIGSEQMFVAFLNEIQGKYLNICTFNYIYTILFHYILPFLR